jgi:hypothetical protein
MLLYILFLEEENMSIHNLGEKLDWNFTEYCTYTPHNDDWKYKYLSEGGKQGWRYDRFLNQMKFWVPFFGCTFILSLFVTALLCT